MIDSKITYKAINGDTFIFRYDLEERDEFYNYLERLSENKDSGFDYEDNLCLSYLVLIQIEAIKIGLEGKL